MLRALSYSIPVCLVVALSSCADAGSTSNSGLTTVTSLAPEPAGAACPTGGMRVSAGLDANTNGLLDPDEVKSSQVVCNGLAGKDGATGATGADGKAGTNGTNGTNGSGTSSLIAVIAEPNGANCANGGTRITSGPDTNGNGTLDDSEVTATRYVCNGATSTATDAVTVYDSDHTNVQSTSSVTVLSAVIAAPGAGKVVAVSSADTFCASPATTQGYDCAASGPTAGYYTLANTSSADAMSGSYDFFYVSPNATENTTRTAVFDVAAAGNVTVYLRAKTNGAGQYAFFRTSLTLLYVP